MTTLLSAAKALNESLDHDENGVFGQGGNGGLISRKTIRLNDELRQEILKAEAAQKTPQPERQP